uniref:Protein kinase C zeta n=1 Tax=Rousettus aegyptiacus TaxID=9407 RepID=A0A7J8KEU3_ROUAE|nr:protein kinase C zeta [Rousettus aegyptiacus]
MDSVMPSQEPAVDDKDDDVDLPSEETGGITYISSTRKRDSLKDDSEALKPVIDGMDGIKISQGLGLQDFDLIRVIGRGSYAKEQNSRAPGPRAAPRPGVCGSRLRRGGAAGTAAEGEAVPRFRRCTLPRDRTACPGRGHL